MSISPESDFFSTFERDFHLLDQATHDPFITDVVKDAVELNELMKTEATTVEDARSIVQTLDAMWGAINDTIVKVTGNVTYKTPDGEFHSQYYEDVEMISKGFMITGSQGETEAQYGRKVRFTFLMDIPDEMREEYRDELEDLSHIIMGADVDQVSIEAQGYSVERAKAWLTIYAQDLLEDIDELVMNAEGNEIDSLLALRDLDFSKIEGDENTRITALQCISVYLMDMFAIEEKVPYVVSLSGRIMMKNENDDDIFARTSSKEHMAYIHGISAIDTNDEDIATGEVSNPRTDLYLYMTVLNNDPNAGGYSARVPLDSILTLESLRLVLKK